MRKRPFWCKFARAKRSVLFGILIINLLFILVGGVLVSGSPAFWLEMEILALFATAVFSFVFWLAAFLWPPADYELVARPNRISKAAIGFAIVLTACASLVGAALLATKNAEVIRQRAELIERLIGNDPRVDRDMAFTKLAEPLPDGAHVPWQAALLLLGSGLFCVNQILFLKWTARDQVPVRERKLIDSPNSGYRRRWIEKREDYVGGLYYSDVPCTVAFVLLLVVALLAHPTDGVIAGAHLISELRIKTFVAGAVTFQVVASNVVFAVEYGRPRGELRSSYEAVKWLVRALKPRLRRTTFDLEGSAGGEQTPGDMRNGVTPPA